VTAEERKFGELPMLLVRMNPDLSMGEDLLKQTGAGNLFTVFGEPNVQIDRTSDGMIEVEVRGVDVYDPTTARSAPMTRTRLPAGSSTPTTTAKASSCTMPTSPAPTTRASAYAKRSRP
jgi:hypothetical protein